MIRDRRDTPLAGARDLFDAAVVRPPDCAMAHLAKAWRFALATEPEAPEAVRGILAGLDGRALDDRAAGHMAALRAVPAGDWTRGARAMGVHSLRFPRDLTALQAEHMLDVLRVDARTLRDRIARALPHWHGAPGRGFVQGMHAFGLEETGAPAAAEAAGREAHWAPEDNFLKVHNGWRRALCHIELDAPAAALTLFDGPIEGGPIGDGSIGGGPAGGGASAQDQIDAAALLWRLDLIGVEVGDRWAKVSAAWEAHADGRLYPFNDLHAAMAYLGAGRGDKVEALLTRMAAADGSETAAWIAATGRPLVEGFAAFRAGRHREAAQRLWSARHIVNAFGGGHAQRDVIDWTLTEAALRGGPAEMAEALARERRALRPHSPVNRAWLHRAQALPRAA